MTQTTLSPEERAKSLGEKLSEAFDQTQGHAVAWTEMTPEQRKDYEVTALWFAGSLTHDETASAVITSLRTALEEAEGREHRVCDGCGLSRSMTELKASGHVSCCPERKMLTATEWAARAEKAEQQRDGLLGVLARVRVMFRLDLRKMLEFGKHYNQAVKDVHDAVEAALSPSKSEATMAETMPELQPMMLTNLSYGDAVKQMHLTGCAVRRPHWCDPVLVWGNDRVMMDDGEEFLPWEPTSQDERAADWRMVAREEPSDDR